MPCKRSRQSLVSFLVLLVCLGGAVAAGTTVLRPAGPISSQGNFDVRYGPAGAVKSLLQSVDLRNAAARARATGLAMRQGAAALAQASPGAEVRLAPLVGAAEIVRNPRGALTAASSATGRDIVIAYLRAHPEVYGLTEADIQALVFKGESLSRRNGLRMERFEQAVGGIRVFQSDTRFLVDRDGRLVRSVGLLVPRAVEIAPAYSGKVSPVDALVTAMQSVGIGLDRSRMRVTRAAAPGQKGVLRTGDPRVPGDVSSELVYFPLAPGVLVPAWMQITFTTGPGDWTTLVDATTGALLWRKNLRAHASTQEARFSVYAQSDAKTPAESPAPHSPTNVTPGSGTQFPEISRTTVSMSAVQNLTASPNGWIDDGGSTTTGNNVDAYLDVNDTDAPNVGLLDDNGRPVGNLDGSGNQRDFLGTGYAYTPAPQGGNPDAGTAPTDTQFQRGSVTQLFYDTNWYHDQLYSYGFDEAAGNFQTNNFGHGGTGGDPVLAECQDGSGTDNSNFSTPPDGNSGRMQMYLFDFPTPERDGTLDATIVLHELTHGLSNRLIGDGNGLIWDEGGGMGEGWSDFYALSLLFGQSNAYPPDAEYVAGAYATYQFLGLTDNYLYGIRRFPYSTDNTISPLTWADVDDITINTGGGIAPSPLNAFFAGGGAMEVHNIGEIWALSLWEVRSRIIADPAGANGDVPTGNATMLQLTTDGLKMTPLNPSFVDARDALIDADCATNGCANEKSIWDGFADRGLGYKAVAPLGQDGILGVGAYLGVGESFASPYLDVDTTTVDDSLGNGNGAIDPGEPVQLTVNLFNPWRNPSFDVASATATLTTSTPGVTILTATASYGAIAHQASVGGTPFLFTVSPSAVCGQSIHFTLTSVSAIGTKAVDFTLRVGAPAGTGAPVTYTRTIPGGLAIPDSDLQGVTDSLTITDDLEISDLNFEVDSLTHTFTGDLVVGMKAPSGYGTSLIFLRGIFIGDADGDNFTNTVIDGSSTNDLNLSGAADAPFTGDWLPAFNSPIWALFGIPNFGPDSVDQLGRVNGLSTQGTWNVHVADEAEADTGTLNAWSLIVTPRAFACAAFTPQVQVSATKTVAGSFTAGGAVTYTIVLSNTGNAAQADNPGPEFSDVLPADLALVSASATSGTAVATVATNTVTWDGTIPAVLGQVTITIQATIKGSGAGKTIANQGSLAFDADGNGTNESSGVSDDPATVAPNDPTAFLVAAPIAAIPTLSVAGAAALGALLLVASLLLLRRRG